jgi:hypothetical protein
MLPKAMEILMTPQLRKRIKMLQVKHNSYDFEFFEARNAQGKKDLRIDVSKDNEYLFSASGVTNNQTFQIVNEEIKENEEIEKFNEQQ